MNNVIETMIAKCNPQNNDERENAIKEIIQEIASAGLSRAGVSKQERKWFVVYKKKKEMVVSHLQRRCHLFTILI